MKTVNVEEEIFKDVLSSFLVPDLQDTISIISSKTKDDTYEVILTVSHAARKNTLYLMNSELGLVYGSVNTYDDVFTVSSKLGVSILDIQNKFKEKTNLNLDMTLQLSNGANKRLKHVRARKSR